MLAFLVSPLGKLCGYGLVALVLLATAAGVKHEWDLGQAARVQVHQIQSASKAAVVAVAKVDRYAAAAETAAQTKIVVETRTIKQKVPLYVTASTPCIPWSVVRLHDAAVAGVDPGTLQPPTGQSDDACSDVAPSAFVGTVVDNYAAARSNAEQLDALEADIAARAQVVAPEAAASGGPPVTAVPF